MKQLGTAEVFQVSILTYLLTYLPVDTDEHRSELVGCFGSQWQWFGLFHRLCVCLCVFVLRQCIVAIRVNASSWFLM